MSSNTLMEHADRVEDLDPLYRAGATRAKPLRLVLADDHKDLLDELRSLLAPEFEVVCAVSGGDALLQAVLALRPDAVIADVNMPGLNGIDAGRRILEKGLCNSVIILTMYNEPQLVHGAFQAGIRGYVLKIDAGEELIAALRAVISGKRYLSQGVLGRYNGLYSV